MIARAVTRSRSVALSLLAVLALGLVLAPGALAGALTPESGGSPNADDIDALYKIVFVIAAVIFLIVEGSLFYCLFKYKARKGRVAAQIHGNTNLEIGWTVGAAVILVVLALVTFLKLGAIQNPPNSDANAQIAGSGVLVASTDEPTPPNGKALRVCVTGRQYIWRYTYLGATGSCKQTYGKPFSYEEMVAPAGTSVVLQIESTDVAHSWWIPALGGKFDAIPGYTNYTWFKAPKPGVTYAGQCAELCGRNHADMTARVRVVSPDQFEAYLANLKKEISSANKDSETLRKQLEKQGDL